MAVQPDAGTDDELQRLRRLLDVSQRFGRFGVWERDVATGVGHWEPQLFRLFGLPEEGTAPPFERVMAVLRPEVSERLRAFYLGSVCQPGRHEMRYPVHHGDGRVLWLHSIWQVPEQGTLVQGVIIDETEVVHLGRQHEIAQTQLAMMSRLAGMSLWRTDLATQRIFRGEQVWHATGVDPGPQGIPVAELRALIHPDDLAATDRASQAALAGGDTADVETRYRTPEGGWRTMLTRRVAQRDGEGRPVAVLGVGFDITEQVEARERYKHLVEQFELVVAAAGIGLWTLDLDSGEQTWNGEMRRLYGLGEQEPVPASGPDGIHDFVLPEDHEALRHATRQVSASGQATMEAGWRIRRRDGQVRTLVGRARQLSGGRRLIAGVALDVTELRAAEQAQRDKAAAERASRAKTEFLSQMSHELRTPLNAVLGFAQVLLLAGPDSLTFQQRVQIQHIQTAGWHLLALINDALDLSQIEARRTVTDCVAVALGPVLDEGLAMVVAAATQRGVRLLPPAPPGHDLVVMADRTRLLQVVLNLLTNAVKYNQTGGQVLVTMGRDAAAGQAWVRVLDTGLGMTPEQLAQLFEPFNRLGREHSLVEGSGIGLALSRLLVQQMGGRIEVNSSNAGSEFKLWLRLAGD